MAPIVRCVGDCDLSNDVTIDELITGVNVALGSTTLAACEMFDHNRDFAVTVEELVGGVRQALTGCIDPLTPGDHRRLLMVDGVQRLYDLHVPPAYDGSTAVPLVLNFHGLQNNITRFAGRSGFRTLSDTDGFLVAYPLGLWCDTDGCSGATPDEHTDVGASFCDVYVHCSAGVRVGLCSIEANPIARGDGTPLGHDIYLNPDIEVARTAWVFLSRFWLPAER
jgi:hypothetical protein